jgi:hypothetical protein
MVIGLVNVVPRLLYVAAHASLLIDPMQTKQLIDGLCFDWIGDLKNPPPYQASLFGPLFHQLMYQNPRAFVPKDLLDHAKKRKVCHVDALQPLSLSLSRSRSRASKRDFDSNSTRLLVVAQ